VFFQRSIECKVKAPESKLDLSNSVESFFVSRFHGIFLHRNIQVSLRFSSIISVHWITRWKRYASIHHRETRKSRV